MKAERSRLPPAERIDLIVNEALRLFAERHFAAVSVREVADACGIEVELFETTEASTQGAALLAHAQLAGANLAEYAASLRRSPTIVSPRTPHGEATWRARREAWREAKDLSRESIPELSAVHF